MAAGIEPGNGTWTIFVTPDACMKRCMPRNGALPGPAEEKVSPPGVDFARSMKSFINTQPSLLPRRLAFLINFMAKKSQRSLC